MISIPGILCRCLVVVLLLRDGNACSRFHELCEDQIQNCVDEPHCRDAMQKIQEDNEAICRPGLIRTESTLRQCWDRVEYNVSDGYALLKEMGQCYLNCHAEENVYPSVPSSHHLLQECLLEANDTISEPRIHKRKLFEECEKLLEKGEDRKTTGGNLPASLRNVGKNKNAGAELLQEWECSGGYNEDDGAYVECSVSGEDCFPLSATVSTQSGPIPMGNLTPHTQILSISEENASVVYSPVMSVTRKRVDVQQLFVEIEFLDGYKSSSVSLSPRHYIYKVHDLKWISDPAHIPSEAQISQVPVQATDVIPGDFIWKLEPCERNMNGCLVPVEVIGTTKYIATGRVAPVTLNGNLIVDGILTSSYAEICGLSHSYMHTGLAPVRYLYDWVPDVVASVCAWVSNTDVVTNFVLSAFGLYATQ